MSDQKAEERELKEIIRAIEKLGKKHERSAFELYTPYPKQLEFLSCKKHEKILFGANRGGKTTTEGFEVTCHLTGIYPSWWKGVRYDRPIVAWAAGESIVRVRDTIQEKLLGGIGRLGTGLIPSHLVMWDDITKKSSNSAAHAFDLVPIKHANGGISTLQFFSYDQSRDKFQGSSVDWVWFDEEPKIDIYNECRMRVLDRHGYITMTFTPLQGLTELYIQLINNNHAAKYWLTWDDVTHLDATAKETFTVGMSEEEKLARTKGIATIGSGLVFQFSEEDYLCEDFEIPRHWPEIGGLDVGYTHPTGAVKLRYDEECDTVYVTHDYQVSGKDAAHHARSLKHWGCEFFVSKDAFNRSGLVSKYSTAELLRDNGLDTIHMADMSDGSLKDSIQQICARISTGRFYIFRSCVHAREEFKLYKKNKDGKIVKVHDDVISAIRYAIMGLDKAKPPSKRGKQTNNFTISDGSSSSGGYSGF